MAALTLPPLDAGRCGAGARICECPETVEELFDNAQLSTSAKEKVGGGNAAEFFGLGDLKPLAASPVATAGRADPTS